MLCLLAMMTEEEEERKRRQENLGDLLMRGTVKNVTDLEEELNKCTLKLFDVCEHCITPLMAACLLGYKDIVRFLLEKGANPNEKCTEESNTPLHYACLQGEYIEKTFVEWTFEAKEDLNTRKEDIIKLLFSYGAVLERNTIGFLPIHCAALFAMESIVDYFIDEETVDDEDRIMAVEVLGISQAFLLTQMSKGYFSFLTAIHLRLEKYGCPSSHSSPSELEVLMECKECTTFDELHKLKHDHTALTIQGLLVGDRVLPEKLKQKCLWPNIFHTCAPLVEKKTFLSLCQYGLKLESSSRLGVGIVLDGIKEFLWDYMTGTASLVDANQQEALLSQIASYLVMYKDILLNVEPEYLAYPCVTFSYELGIVLATVIGRFIGARRVLFDAILKATIDIVEICTERRTYMYECSDSVAITLFEQVVDDIYDPDILSKQQMRSVLVQMNHALPLLLQYEHARYITSPTRDTLLHLTMRLLFNEQDFDVICALTHQLVRHSCPIQARTWMGETARSLVLAFAADTNIQIASNPKLEEILALVTKPENVLSLQELTARCILQSRIRYSLGTIPSTLYAFLHGEDFW